MTRRARIFLAAASAASLAAFGAGLIMIGTPWDIRGERLDANRVSDLRSLSVAIRRYHGNRDRLPAALTELEEAGTAAGRMRDPTSRDPYEYRPGEDSASFTLCAWFDGRSRSEPDTQRFWDHGAGHDCFDFEVDETRR